VKELIAADLPPLYTVAQPLASSYLEGAAMNRRELLRTTGAAAVALGLSRFPMGWAADKDAPKRRILMYTRSQGFQHDCVRRKDGKLALAEQIVTDLGQKHNFEVNCQKDGRVFVNEDLSKYDAFLFETQGNLSAEKCQDGSPPMPPEGKQALLDAIAKGKGFVGCHCASDTFHSKGPAAENQTPEDRDPYIRMVGGEFIRHGRQQNAIMRVVDAEFPGAKDLKDFKMHEEWYSLKNFAPDLHVILVQDTESMTDFPKQDPDYVRPSYPATWARMHQKGRVFFTSMGHKDEVWKSDIFQQLLLGALAWATGNVNADVPANIEKVTPKASELPRLK
jgi:type 1 glutamine amidotransferase